MITTVDRICQQCGKSFSTPAWRVRQGKGKFCSVACHNAFQKDKPSPTSPEKLSLAQKASYQRNPRRAINNSRIMKELWRDPSFRQKTLETRDTPEAKRKQSEGSSRHSRQMWQDPQTRAKIIQSRKQTYEDPQYRGQLSKRFKKAWQNLEFRAKMSEIRKQLWQDPEFVQMMSEAQSKAALKRWQAPEYRQNQIEAQKRSWEDPEIVAKRFAGFNKKPNKPEQKLINIFSTHLPHFQYNGDFSLGITLGGLIPDFVNVNGKKEVIELLGNYFHSPDITRDRWQGSELGKVMLYNSLGYKCLILWESELSELSEDEVVEKVTSFFRVKR